MSNEVISIIVLVAIFVIATVLPINMGVLGLVAAFLLSLAIGVSEDDLVGGFPGDLFVVLVGVTYLFAIAKNNGTVDWLVGAAVRAVGGRVVLIPWVMFVVAAILTSVGSVVPAAVAIIAPVGLRFAVKYNINPVLMGLLVINGAGAGGFSPISVWGVIVDGVTSEANLAENPFLLWAGSFCFNLALSVVAFVLFGGRELFGRRESADEPGERQAPSPSARPGIAGGAGDAPAADEDDDEPVTTLDRDRILTLVGIGVLVVVALAFDVDVGFVALSVALVLSLINPTATKGAVGQVAWPTVLLICGVVTYVSLMETIGTIDYLGEEVANFGTPLISALLICFIGAAVSAFASTTGILGALIPLAVPFLETGAVGAVGMIIALAISSSVVDSSPFSTSGALVVANSPEDRRDFVFKRLMQWGISLIFIAPPIAWLIFVVPGWL